MSKIPVELGRVVIAKCGRGAGRKYLVTKVIDEDFVLIADGKTRTAQKQKKKRIKHLTATKTLNEEMRKVLIEGGMPEDHQMRTYLSKEEG
ncbi:MAG: KOW domain-containing protein [Christensenellales bacterium]|jgi:ribosomal protein L14E/L6E/L27E